MYCVPCMLLGTRDTQSGLPSQRLLWSSGSSLKCKEPPTTQHLYTQIRRISQWEHFLKLLRSTTKIPEHCTYPNFFFSLWKNRTNPRSVSMLNQAQLTVDAILDPLIHQADSKSILLSLDIFSKENIRRRNRSFFQNYMPHVISKRKARKPIGKEGRKVGTQALRPSWENSPAPPSEHGMGVMLGAFLGSLVHSSHSRQDYT